MITQLNLLKVNALERTGFESAFREAATYLQAAQGYLGHSLSRSVESAGTYLLIIQWNSLEDHTERFRNDAAHLHWKRLLGPFYSEPPDSLHFYPPLAVGEAALRND